MTTIRHKHTKLPNKLNHNPFSLPCQFQQTHCWKLCCLNPFKHHSTFHGHKYQILSFLISILIAGNTPEFSQLPLMALSFMNSSKPLQNSRTVNNCNTALNSWGDDAHYSWVSYGEMYSCRQKRITFKTLLMWQPWLITFISITHYDTKLEQIFSQFTLNQGDTFFWQQNYLFCLADSGANVKGENSLTFQWPMQYRCSLFGIQRRNLSDVLETKSLLR